MWAGFISTVNVCCDDKMKQNNICTVYSFPQISGTIFLVIVYVALHSSLSLFADIKINFNLKLALFSSQWHNQQRGLVGWATFSLLPQRSAVNPVLQSVAEYWRFTQDSSHLRETINITGHQASSFIHWLTIVHGRTKPLILKWTLLSKQYNLCPMYLTLS